MAFSQTSSESEFRFEAEINDPKKLIPMLKAIQIKKTTVMAITCRGLKLTCEDPSKCLQATSFIDRSLFTRYYMSSEETPATACFRLLDLLNVLSIFGSSQASHRFFENSLHISFSSLRDDLVLRLKNNSSETKAKIKTYSSEELMLIQTNFCNKIIINSEPIVDFWRGADLTSDYIKISIYGQSPYLQWTTESPRAKVNHNIHRDSTEVEQYVHTTDVSNRYKMSLMKCSLKALSHTSKLSIRTDEDGLLSLQFMIDLDQADIEHCFVEYFIVPENDNQFD